METLTIEVLNYLDWAQEMEEYFRDLPQNPIVKQMRQIHRSHVKAYLNCLDVAGLGELASEPI